jgi:hypothetical protein
MSQTTGYKRAHELAGELLAMKDMPVILAMPVFDIPRLLHALPVKAVVIEVEGEQCVLISPSKTVNQK